MTAQWHRAASILSLLVILGFWLSAARAGEDGLGKFLNPYDAACYDWRGKRIPCDFRTQYAELFADKPIPQPRFVDNQDGTVTDRLTDLVWLKNANCFGRMDWKSAAGNAKRLKAGDCGPHPALVLVDGSSAGDWRLPTMQELCALIDFSRREPALPGGHPFAVDPSGYHWSATTLDDCPNLAWIVYMESGTTCYENIDHRAGYLWPVRERK